MAKIKNLTPDDYPTIPAKEKIVVPEALGEQMGDVVGLWRRPSVEAFKVDSVNTLVGQSAGASITAGYENTYVGEDAGGKTTTGSSNTFVGEDSGINNTTGDGNICLGYRAGKSLSTGEDNICIGVSAGQTVAGGANITGDENIMIGSASGRNIDSGSNNISIGWTAGYNIRAGDDNVCIGKAAGYFTQTGNNNVAVGNSAGKTNISGGDNVFIGSNAGFYETGSNKLFIDNAARVNEADGRAKALIYGVFAAAIADQIVTLNAKVSIAAAPLTNKSDLALLGDGVLTVKETTTPTADTNYGKVYCKNDNKLYFQDGAGTEHEVAFV